MKRRTPLKSRTGLKSTGLWRKKLKQNDQSTSGESFVMQPAAANQKLKQSSLKGSGKLNAKSDKRKQQEKEYSKLRLAYLTLNKQCAVYPHLAATEVHHIKGRNRFYLDVSTWLAVSREGHEFIHNNVAIAREKGWLEYGRDAK